MSATSLDGAFFHHNVVLCAEKISQASLLYFSSPSRSILNEGVASLCNSSMRGYLPQNPLISAEHRHEVLHIAAARTNWQASRLMAFSRASHNPSDLDKIDQGLYVQDFFGPYIPP